MLTLTQIDFSPETNLPLLDHEQAHSIVASYLEHPATPQHTRRIIQRAIDLAIHGYVSHNGHDAFEVHSQSDPDVWYEVRDGQCSCPSYRDNPGHLGQRPICKHTLAVSIHKAALGHLLAEHVLPMDGPNIRITRQKPWTYLLLSQTSQGTALVNTESPALRVPVQWNNAHGWLPTRPEDYIKLFRWLQKAPATPEQKERYAAYNEHLDNMADWQASQTAMTGSY